MAIFYSGLNPGLHFLELLLQMFLNWHEFNILPTMITALRSVIYIYTVNSFNMYDNNTGNINSSI